MARTTLTILAATLVLLVNHVVDWKYSYIPTKNFCASTISKPCSQWLSSKSLKLPLSSETLPELNLSSWLDQPLPFWPRHWFSWWTRWRRQGVILLPILQLLKCLAHLQALLPARVQVSCSAGKKHRKNCECCPVSLLIVRSQRLSWIQFLKCQRCNQCLKSLKSLFEGALQMYFSLSLSLSLSLSPFFG